MKSSGKLLYIYITRFYTAVVSIAFLPLILDIVGSDAYGLIGFFIVFQACLRILDIGVGGVLIREFILTKKSKVRYDFFLKVHRNITIIFSVITFVVFLFFYYFSDYFIKKWINSDLSYSTIHACLFLSLVVFAFKYISGPNKSILLGDERHILLGNVNMFYMSMTSIFAYFVLKVEGRLEFYFYVQVFAAFIEYLLLYFYSKKVLKYRLLILSGRNDDKDDTVPTIFSLIKFAISMSYLAMLWVLMNQSDKITLTKVMSLSDYAFYSMAVSLVGLIGFFSGPLNQWLQPKLTHAHSDKDFVNYTKLFETSLLLVFIVLTFICCAIYFYGTPIVYIWSGSLSTAENVNIYLPWLFFGTAIGVINNYCFLLHYSHGTLNKHAVFCLFFGVTVLVLNIYIANIFLGHGSSIFFFIQNTISLFLWTIYSFRRVFSGVYCYLLFRIAPVLVVFPAVFYFLPLSGGGDDILIKLILKLSLCAIIVFVMLYFIYSVVLKKNIAMLKYRF